MANRKYVLDERAEAILRERYDSHPQTVTELCNALKVPRYTLKRWAQTLGLARTKDERTWTEKEIQYLESNYHRLHVITMAKHLKRTTTAVALKTKRLGIRKCDEGYTVNSLSLALGVDTHKVTRWIERGLLKAARRNTNRERDVYYLSEVSVREFIVRYPLEIDVRRVDGLWLIDLLANGPSPRSQRRRDP